MAILSSDSTYDCPPARHIASVCSHLQCLTRHAAACGLLTRVARSDGGIHENGRSSDDCQRNVARNPRRQTLRVGESFFCTD